MILSLGDSISCSPLFFVRTKSCSCSYNLFGDSRWRSSVSNDSFGCDFLWCHLLIRMTREMRGKDILLDMLIFRTKFQICVCVFCGVRLVLMLILLQCGSISRTWQDVHEVKVLEECLKVQRTLLVFKIDQLHELGSLLIIGRARRILS